jgi:hypothetical protein
MIPISLSWDTQKISIILKWNGFVSLKLKSGKTLTKILGIPIPSRFKKRGVHIPMQWVYIKGVFSFLTQWRIKKVEGTFSFQDPMVNGIIYGWLSAIDSGRADRKINLSANFLGENWCRGEVVVSPKTVFHHFRRWILPLFMEMRRRRPKMEVKSDGSNRFD